MSVTVDGKKYHVALSDGTNKYGFNIVKGSDSRMAVNDWAPIFSAGDQQFAEGTWQPLAWDDWSLGVGSERFAVATKTQYFHGTLDTRVGGRVTLGGRWISSDAAKTATANPKDFLANVYVPCGTVLRKLTVATGLWSDANAVAFGANVTHIHVDGASLYVALGDAVDAQKYDGTNFSTLTGFQGNCFATALGKLWRAKANHIYGSIDAGASWPTDVTVEDASANITALVPYGDKLYIFKENGLWTYDGTTVAKKLDLSTSKWSNNGKFACEWGGYLFFNVLRTIWKFSPTAESAITPVLTGDTNKELYGWGLPVMLCAAPNALLVAFNGAENADAVVLAYTGAAWHPLYRATSTMAAVGYSRNKDWIIVNDGATRYQAQIAQADRPAADYEASGYIELPWFDAAYRLFTKAGKEIVIESKNCTATETITIKYRTEDDAAWTTLASTVVSSTRPTTISLAPLTGALEFYKIQFRLEFARGGTTSLTPMLTSFILRYLIRPPRTYAYSMQLRLSTRQRTIV